MRTVSRIIIVTVVMAVALSLGTVLADEPPVVGRGRELRFDLADGTVITGCTDVKVIAIRIASGNVVKVLVAALTELTVGFNDRGGLVERVEALVNALDKLLEHWDTRGREWIQANNEPNRPAVKLAPTHVYCHSSLVLHAYDRQHGIEAVVPVPRKLHKALEVPVSGKLKQGKAIVSYYRGKRIDNLLAASGAPMPPSSVGGTEYDKHEALSGSVTITPLPVDTERQKVEVTFKDLVFKGFQIKKIGPLKAQLGLVPPP